MVTAQMNDLLPVTEAGPSSHLLTGSSLGMGPWEVNQGMGTLSASHMNKNLKNKKVKNDTLNFQQTCLSSILISEILYPQPFMEM